MPLINPEIQELLRQAGLQEPGKVSKDGRTVGEKLDAAGLSLDETLEELHFVVKNSGNEALRVRCLETIMKAHGALKESAPAPPSFTIIIQENSAIQNPTSTPATNQQTLKGVNPILLPRQLLKTSQETVQ